MVQPKSASSYLYKGLVIFFLLLLTMLCLLPIVHTLATSFSSRAAVISGRVGLLPVGFSTIAYERILDDSMFIQSFKNSVVRVILGGGINLVLTILTAYPLSRSRERFPQRNIYMWYIVFSMLFAGGIIPSYLLIKNPGLLDTIWVLVLPGALPIFNMLVLMNYFRGLPSEIEEAAVIDGASAWVMMVKIMVPLAIPSIATVTLFSIVNHWNAFFDGVIYINSGTKKPLQTYLQSLVIDQSQFMNMTAEERQRLEELTSKNFNAAKLLVSMIPILAVYPFLQRFFVTGLVLGSVKS